MSYKFGDDALAEAFYAKSLYETYDEQIGAVDELGWFCYFRDERVILKEDDRGFVYATQHDTLQLAEAAWEAIAKAYEDYDASDDQDYEYPEADSELLMESDLYDMGF